MHESVRLSCSDAEQLDARKQLFGVMKRYPSSEEEMERSLGLFIRGSLLARLLAIQEIYERIAALPGSILDIGTWRGQTAVVCENLRAIHEPLNFQRRIFAFDTFEGYTGFSERDRDTPIFRDGTYTLPEGYDTLLRELLELHERNNAMGHVHGKHEVIKGDCRETLPAFLERNPNEMIALAWFDLNALEPTEFAFRQIIGRVVPGGIVAFWQLTRDYVPAEGAHYVSSILNAVPHTLHKARSYPSLCYLVVRK